MIALHTDATPSAADTAFIRLERVYKIHRIAETGVAALGGVSLEVPRTRFAVILGPSGAGKSTILNLIGGVETATAGVVSVAGIDISQLDAGQRSEYRRRTVGFLWQDPAKNLVPYLTAFRNVELPLLLAGVQSATARRERVRDLLDLFDLRGRANHLPAMLSGGEQQRVALAVALANAPSILLADEPTAEIDRRASADVVDTLRRVCVELGTTVVAATHDLEAASRADVTYRLLDGRIRGPAGRATIDAAGRLVLPDVAVDHLGPVGSEVEVEIEGAEMRIRRSSAGDARVDAPESARPGARSLHGGPAVDSGQSHTQPPGPPRGPVLLSGHDLRRRYRSGPVETVALRGVSIELAAGEILAVTGPSGSGKSTLLGLLAGLDDPDAGEVSWGGRPLPGISAAERADARASSIGIVFQSLGLFPFLTAHENVVLPLLVSGARPGLAAKAADRWLERVGLADRLEHRLNELSLGQQQRVAVARALATEPKIVLCDEPTAELDHQAASVIVDALHEARRRGGGVLIASHDPRVLLEADRVLVLRDGVGVAEGAPRDIAGLLITD